MTLECVQRYVDSTPLTPRAPLAYSPDGVSYADLLNCIGPPLSRRQFLERVYRDSRAAGFSAYGAWLYAKKVACPQENMPCWMVDMLGVHNIDLFSNAEAVQLYRNAYLWAMGQGYLFSEGRGRFAVCVAIKHLLITNRLATMRVWSN